VWVKSLAHAAERGAIRCRRAVLPPRLPRHPDGRVLVHLGCGFINHPDFVNVDALVASHIHHIRPLDELSVFPDNHADLVYASHCLEHFGHRDTSRILTEWRRVLKPGGVLRLGVPDFDQLLAIYEAAGKDIAAIQVFLMGNQDYPMNAHYTMFTKASLTKDLHGVGFREVRPWARGTDGLTSLDDCTGLCAEVNGTSFPISLNLEAVK
jgi:predicted SAM-dependent methyltransferase